jgi:two-component system, NarL family, invasion response regulator UvrY
MKILIADDHPVVRQGLCEIISKDRAIKQVCEVDSGYKAIEKARCGRFDVIILDISMPGMNGIETVKQLKKEGIRTPVLILSMYPEEQYALRALRAGASGYLTKEAPAEDLIKALKQISRGGKYINHGIAEILANAVNSDNGKMPHELLSDREYEVFQAITAGKSIREISNEFHISNKTVHTYRTRVMDKLQIKSNADMVAYSRSHGLIRAS